MTRIEKLEAERARLSKLMREQRIEAQNALTARIAWDRDESEPCERGTVGCSIAHDSSHDDACESW